MSSSNSGGGLSSRSGVGTGDTSLWLHNKLGTSNDSWTGGSIVSQLSPETFMKIHQCFQDLQPQVKLKLLLSLFHIPKRNLEAWKFELGKILDVGKEDSEPWVCMLAEIMQTYPTTGQLNSDISVPESNKRIFMDLLNDIRKALKKSTDITDSVLPLECHYLNKNAFISVVGHQPSTVRHFNLKRKPKAAALRAELLAKSADAANKVKSINSGVFPVRKSTMPRKMDSSSGGGGLKASSRILNSGFRNSRNSVNTNSNSNSASNHRKKEGGVKLLDINEQPLGFNASKKRKRPTELEEPASKNQLTKETSSSSTPSGPTAPKVTQPSSTSTITSVVSSTCVVTSTPVESTTTTVTGQATTTTSPPDYAAGLASLNARPAIITLPTSSSTSSPIVVPQQTPSYAPPPVYAPKSVTIVNKPATGQQPVLTNNIFPPNLSSLEPYPPTPSSIEVTTPRIVTVPAVSSTVSTLTSSSRIVQLPTHPLPQTRVHTLNRSSSIPMSILGGANVTAITAPPGSNVAASSSASIGGAAPRIVTPVTVRPVLQPHIVANTTQKSVLIPPPGGSNTSSPAPQQTPQPQAAPVRRGLTLTKEQMHEAQEMFRTANKVTRPEKALILGFMAGSRDNPCPHLGNLVTIKLSENQENVPQKDGTSLSTVIETHFQMNYSTGQWKCIKKYRRMDD